MKKVIDGQLWKIIQIPEAKKMQNTLIKYANCIEILFFNFRMVFMS